MQRKKICVLGLGYIGLPTAAMFATHGHNVIGVDVRSKVVDALNNAKITIEEPYLDILVQAAVKSENLIGSTEPEEADVFIIAVPTPITNDKRADMRYVVEAAESIVPYVRKGNIVVLESTSPPGTVSDVLCPILERSGLVLGEELYVGHSPERVLPGKILMELVGNNRIVGGINTASAEKIRDIYKTFVNGEIFLTDETTAEMCKVMENTFRDVNIALANELTKICEKTGIDAWEVIKLCNKHPRVNIHQPGPGVGGHCLAIDPWFIVEKNPHVAQIIKLSRQTNDSMPHFVADIIDDMLGESDYSRKICMLGVTYKADVDDTRESPIIDLISVLGERGYEVAAYDPHATKFTCEARSLEEAASECDLVVLGVNHEVFKKINLTELCAITKGKLFLDLRNFMNKEELEKAGFMVRVLGNGKLQRKEELENEKQAEVVEQSE